MASLVFAHAVDRWREIRDEWQFELEHKYLEAESFTRGHLLNRAGREKRVDPRTLVSGPQQRVEKYASEELLEYFSLHGRLTFQDFETERFTPSDHFCANCGTVTERLTHAG